MMAKYGSFDEDETSRRLSALLVARCPEVHHCEFVVRAPGRVNLIGEHIDYSGYAVLPMALRQAVYIAVSSQLEIGQERIKIISENKTLDEYEGDKEIVLNFASNGPPRPLKWYHYALCGFRGFGDYAKRHFSKWTPPSICLLVGNGNDPAYLPMNAGLSSSSALVVASAMAVMRATHTYVEPRVLADICANCERLIGTQGGGMDQAACLLSHSSPIMIEFTKPTLTITPVRIPKGGVFCVADSGARLNKAATPDYNSRVSQCKQAAKILHKHLRNKPDIDEELLILGDVQKAYGKAQPSQMLGPGSPIEEAFPGKLAENAPARCARHCYSEAQRVLDFKDLCKRDEVEEGDEDANKETLRKLGELMNASHESCRHLYNCSCSELDQLVNICRSAGSYGSRLTGAGWGGCVISLVAEDHVQQFLEIVAKTYYNTSPDAVSQKLFFTLPGKAAGFVDITP
ncbi:N acetylgalactosamine kinase [Echinococcus multilocularis]|uniref:N acetylgalactosamine kinase n=1 Tax=Echinococcus multilocularis TaxID=6211 RepID=A0A068YA71_ECHMU|nr:N acetylgalactosamine kinase [Echinococcus multilocularis]